MTRSENNQLLKKRNRSEMRFQFYGLATIMVVLTVLGLMLVSIGLRGATVMQKSFIQVEIEFFPERINYDLLSPLKSLRQVNFRDIIYDALNSSSSMKGFELTRNEVHQLMSPGSETMLFELLHANLDFIGGTYKIWLLASDDVDHFMKNPKIKDKPSSQRRLNDAQISYLEDLQKKGELEFKFNWLFSTNGASISPELAGVKSALVGSMFTILVTLLLAFPLGIAAAVYIEEFAPRSRYVRFIELNINNLASVPSIVFGLLGLVVFINVMHLPRSSSLVGGLTLALMIMPTIFIAARSALHTVPKAISRAAEALGATRVQVVFHHKIPLALPGIVTGTILGVARALGESAALLMVGMVAFVVDTPLSPKDPATVLPVQIYNWARNPEQGFVDHTAAAIIVLLLFLMFINMIAIYIRKKFEHRW